MKKSFLYIVIILIVSYSCGLRKGHVNEFKWVSSIDSLIQSENKKNRFDGTIVIGNYDGILYQKAIGLANRNWDIQIENDTRFDIASLNKSFQAALILKAVEEEKLSLSDKLVSFFDLPEFNDSITIDLLLTHTSGLPDYDGIDDRFQINEFREFKRLHFTDEEYVAYISGLKPFGSVGGQFHYSNFGYHLLALILEKVYAKPFSEILDEKISKPFGLYNTYSEIDNEVVHGRLAEGYKYHESDQVYVRNSFIDLTLGRRIFSTSEDLYKWTKLLSSGEFISQSSYKLMTTNHLKNISEKIAYGYGFVVFDGGDYEMGNLNIKSNYIIHGGSTEGYKAMLTNINDGQLIIVHLSNIGDQTNELKLTKKIITRILKEQ